MSHPHIDRHDEATSQTICSLVRLHLRNRGRRYVVC